MALKEPLEPISDILLRRNRRKREKLLKEQEEKSSTQQGRVVSSYYSASDMEIIQRIAEKEGIALGGLQHEALLSLVDRYDWQLNKNPAETTTSTTLDKQALDGAFAEVVRTLKEEEL